MSPAWDRVQEIFHAAAELTGGARERLLTEQCAGDPALRAEVESLLAHIDHGPLGDPAPQAPEALPTDFGEYHIIRLLGRGGMGSVFLAERIGRDFTQRVALKLLPRVESLLPASVLAARFARERQILARLEHPGIARLIDGGYGPDGQPYLAMEYVEGDSLAAFLATRRPSLEERLTLFIGICEAVHYAHQRLVIHRDLKPGNIIVTESGGAKLLDFGIATIAEGDEPEEGPTVTAARTGHWFTPAYASPEQLRRERVTTLSDQYSLGVILYEVLTGQRPHDLEGKSQAEVEAIVCHRAPERPSIRVDRGPARQLRGDLDTIVLKALAREPDRRYRSVQDMAEDLRRHLDHLPVIARPDSLGYRTRSFVRRHRTAVAGATLVVLALAGGLIATSWQARQAAAAAARARAALAQSEEVTDFLVGLFQQNDPTVTPVEATFAARTLERGAARLEELADQPAVQARLLDALGLLFLVLGRRDDAERMIGRGLEIRRGLAADSAAIAASLDHLGRVRQAQGRYTEGERVYREALAVVPQGREGAPLVLADILTDLGFLLPYLSRAGESESLYARALALRRRSLGEDHPAVADALLRVAALQRHLGRNSKAEEAAREAIALRRRVLGPSHPKVGAAMVSLADIISADTSRAGEAETAYREGVLLQQRALGGRYLAAVHGLENLAVLLVRQRRLAEAESLQREVIAVRETNLGPKHSSVFLDREALADIWAARGQLDDAIALRRECLAGVREALGPEHPILAASIAGLARLHFARGDLAVAESLYTVGIELRRRWSGARHHHVGQMLVELGAISVARRDFRTAERRLLEGLDILTTAAEPNPESVRRARALLARTYGALGRPADSARVAASSE